MKFTLNPLSLLVVLLFFTITVFAQDQSDELRKTLEMADSYFAKGDYINAKASYQIAVRLAPDDAYAKDRLQQTLGLIKVQMQQNALYAEKILAADDLYNKKDLDGALKGYQSALEDLPGDKYATGRINEIQQIFADNKKKEEDFQSAVTQGDKLMKENNLQGSLDQFKKASGLKPDEVYPKQKISELEKLIAEQKTVTGSYEKAMADADLDIQRKKYDDAIVQLENALKIKPNEALPKQKLEEVRKMKQDYDSYNSIITSADNLYISKDFEKARTEYQKAAAIKPEDEYPKSMLEKIDIALMDISKANKSSYDVAIARADKLFNEQDYEQAMTEYNAALRFKPDEDYAKQRISDINNVLSLRKSQDEAYQQSIARADQLFKDERYDEALEEYNHSISFRPLEQYPKVKIDEIKTIQAKLENQRQIYKSLISGADKLFFADDYEQARDQYRKASDMFPKEQYPLDQIRMINEILGQRDMYTKAVTNADKLLYDKKYDEALSEYRKAAQMNENEIYPQGKIYEIETIIAEEQVARATQRKYDSTLIVADDLFDAGDYVKAMESYKTARQIMPTQGYPDKKMEQINNLIAEKAARDAFDKQYADALTNADELLAAKDYNNALKAYESASSMKPGEDYPKAKISEINGILTDIAREALDQQYTEAISSADKLFAAKDYENAIAGYKSAKAIKPSEQYPDTKISEINAALGEIAAREALDKQYSETIAKADNLFVAKNYEEALAAYQAASNLKPNEPYPGEKIGEINAIVGEIAAKEALDKQYSDAIANADKLLAAQDFPGALAAYQAAQKLKPGEKYPGEKVLEVNKALADIAAKEALDKEYAGAIAKADQLLAVKDYQNAITAYEAALKLKPGETYATDKISEINVALEQIAAQEALDKKYAEAITAADKLLAVGDYQNAIISYQSASELKPGEKYPGDKIGEINGILSDIAAKEALDKKYSETLANADKLIGDKDYVNALAAYKEAQSLKPAEKYPTDRIQEINKALEIIATQKALDDQYAQLVAEGEALQAQEKYTEAREKYEAAVTLKPYDNDLRPKLKEIDSALAEIARKADEDKKFNEAVAFGDKHFAEKDYENARYEYQVANSIKGQEAYPLQKIAEIDAIEAEIRKQKELDNQYNKAIASADDLLSKEQYEEARFAYQEASKLKPAEDYPGKQITEINFKLENLAVERDKAYETAISKADNYFDQQDYPMAKVQYERAIELKKDEVYPLDRLKIVNEQIMKQRLIVQEEYDKSIADADKYYASKLYDNAIESYRASSLLKPDEEYPKEMIRRILKMLSERMIVQINKDPLVINNNTLHKFDFLPVPVKDRRSNYIYFRARNMSPNEYKLIINFGKDQSKNGGVVVRVPAGADLNEYIVRISAQYKWFSDDNNWISFYPEGGDIEVNLMQISYSD